MCLGFRQARSTGDLLAYAVHAWCSALESYGESRVIWFEDNHRIITSQVIAIIFNA